MRNSTKDRNQESLKRFARPVSWLGSSLGAIGALLLAFNEPWSGAGWYFFLGSNTAWILYAVIERVPSLLFMQAVFTLTSLIGIARWSA